MSYNFKETMSKPERLAPGHRMCAGCGGTIAVRNVLRGLHEGERPLRLRQRREDRRGEGRLRLHQAGALRCDICPLEKALTFLCGHGIMKEIS